MQRHYDVVVVGSGYGGGVAASRLARAGKRVAVLERGREFRTGEFPSKLSDLRQQMQVTGKSWRMGSPTGLYDVRLGKDMHVLVGCGLGGGSLINAGVALRPDPRVYRDAAWPDEISRDRLLDEGYARAAHWLRPARDPKAARRTKYQALRQRQRSARQGAGCSSGGGELRGYGQSCGRRATGVHGLRRLLRWLQRRRQEHRCPDLSSRRRSPRRPDLYTRQGAPHRQRPTRHLARAFRAPGRSGSGPRCHAIVGHRRHCRPGGGHARHHRDPAALARARACPVRPAGPRLLGQRRYHRLRLRRGEAGERHRRRPPIARR